MSLKLFSFTCTHFQDDELCSIPGFSHRSQPEKVRTYSYPFEEYRVRVWLYARHRTHAVKLCRHIANISSLDGGSKLAVPDCISKLFK